MHLCVWGYMCVCVFLCVCVSVCFCVFLCVSVRLFELDPTLLTLFNYNTNCGSAKECLSSPGFLEHVTKVSLDPDQTSGWTESHKWF